MEKSQHVADLEYVVLVLSSQSASILEALGLDIKASSEHIEQFYKSKKITKDDYERLKSLRRSIIDFSHQIREASATFGHTVEKNGDQIIAHESYGQISISKPHGGSGNLYGCSIKHDSYIALTLSHSTRHTSNGVDRYFPSQRMFTVNMSFEQWGKLLTNISNSEGVPVTISSIGMRHIESPPYINRTTEIKDQFKTQMQKIAVKVNRLSKEHHAALVGPISGLSKEVRSKIASDISQLAQDIRNDLPYVCDLFDETTQKIVTEAIISVDAALLHRDTDKTLLDFLPE